MKQEIIINKMGVTKQKRKMKLRVFITRSNII